MQHVKEIILDAIGEITPIKSTAEKLDTFLSSLNIEELRTLYKMNENNALNKYIIHHGKEKGKE